jgi:hypothetical protein
MYATRSQRASAGMAEKSDKEIMNISQKIFFKE